MSDVSDKIEITRDVALVLFEMLARSSKNVQPLAPGEQEALWKLEGALESVLPEPLAPNCLEHVAAARTRLAGEADKGGRSNPPTVCFVDVDDTLIRSAGSKRIPMTRTIERVRELHDAGVELYCWSSGGAAYAFQAATEVGIADCFAGHLPKPHIIIDDQPPAEWRSFTCLHPNQAGSMSADEIIGKPLP